MTPSPPITESIGTAAAPWNLISAGRNTALKAGWYSSTAILDVMSGVSNTAGVAIVEVYKQ